MSEVLQCVGESLDGGAQLCLGELVLQLELARRVRRDGVLVLLRRDDAHLAEELAQADGADEDPAVAGDVRPAEVEHVHLARAAEAVPRECLGSVKPGGSADHQPSSIE